MPVYLAAFRIIRSVSESGHRTQNHSRRDPAIPSSLSRTVPIHSLNLLFSVAGIRYFLDVYAASGLATTVCTTRAQGSRMRTDLDWQKAVSIHPFTRRCCRLEDAPNHTFEVWNPSRQLISVTMEVGGKDHGLLVLSELLSCSTCASASATQ
ncbi:hypothetical protein DAEQUDRAFT_437204 [Daedalea quercina L-15889]|uniref:Uncharacterized protein n=1 Tax=Daedalea quercina L-15889 TaxID=1314783 RepID=A0A165NAT3_9APHY|nr:hypothetical protein DAEQUDRAFT_437204 [Daedalea quercina L-15889]